jgi:AraC family transcriptional regulator
MKHILKLQEIAGFTLFEALYPPGLKQPRHTHTLASFSFVLAGNYVEDHGKRMRTRQPSTIIFHPPQESHSVDFQSEQVRILSVQIDFARLAYIREHSIVLDSSASRRTETIAWLGHRIYREFRRANAVSTLAIEGLIFEILGTSPLNQQGTQTFVRLKFQKLDGVYKVTWRDQKLWQQDED